MRIAMTTASYSRACMMYITTHHDDLAGAKRLIGLYTIRFSLFYSYYIYLFLLLLWWLIPIQWSRAHQEIIRSLACVKYIKEGEPLKFNRQFSDTSLFLSLFESRSGQSTLKLLFVLQREEEKFSTSCVIMVIWRSILEHVSNNSFFFQSHFRFHIIILYYL